MDIITGHRGTSHVDSQDMRDANMGVIGSGAYILATGGKLAASITGANEITIADGVVCFQGCVASIGYGQSEVLTLQAGTSGSKRYDLICAQYTKDSDGVEAVSLVVKTGTPTSGTPALPTYTDGSIAGGDTLVEMPLYSVYINGVTAQTVTQIAKSYIPTMTAMIWQRAGLQQHGYTEYPRPTRASEYIVSVNVASTAWVNFHIPNISAIFDGRALVNHYGTTYDGYVKIELLSSGTIKLSEVYNGETRVSNPTWEVYYR